jgi:hypothetical protein
MEVYHGSFVPVDEIELRRCKPHSDFGKGFYVTKLYDQAKRWSKRLGRDYGSAGFITEFTFDDYAFEDEEFRVLRFTEYNESWLDFVVSNRKKDSKPHPYDIVEGPMADDRVSTRINLFLNGEVSRAVFLEELKFERPTHQICICTKRALRTLKFIKKSYTFRTQLLGEILVQELTNRHGFSEYRATELYIESEVYRLIHDPSSDYHLRSWREIYIDLLTELKLN